MFKIIHAVQEMKLELTGAFALTTILLWMVILSVAVIDIVSFIIRAIKG